MTTEIITELDSLISLLESRLPANVQRSENQKQQREFERALRRYFRQLDDVFPYDQIDQIYYKNVRESVGQDSSDLLDTVLMTLRTDLVYRMNGYVAAIYISGTAQMTEWAGLPYEGPAMQQAIDYASAHCAKLVTQMDEETKSRLAKIISDGIKDKRGIEGLKRDIRKEFTDMSHYRARMISRTETNDSLSQAFMDRGKELGITGKEIVGGDPCEMCQANIAEGIVPLNHVFGSGHERPPFHPNCVCALAPAMIRE